MTTQTTTTRGNVPGSAAGTGAALYARTADALDTAPASAGRRGFMKAAGGLFIAFSLPSMTAFAATEPAAQGIEPVAPPDAGRLYAWLAVHPDNTATLYTGKVDVGTGIEIALAQIAAEELDFPLDRLHVVMGTTSHTVDQGPSYGSRTVRYAGPQIRHAAAAGRQALLELAAAHFGTQAGKLAVRDGIVSVKGQSGKSISYGALVAGKRLDMEIGASGKAFDMKVAPDAILKDPSTYTVVGRPAARKDIPAKVTGAFTYIQDVRVEGMLHGRVVRPYGVGAKLLDVDESGLKDIPGFVQVVRRDNFLGVVAETEEAAIHAADKLGSRLHAAGPAAGQAKWSDWHDLPQQAHIWDTLRQTQGGDIQVATQGSVDAALGSAAKKLKATYETPFQMHGSIGPSCAIADVGKDRAILWAGTQMPHQARRDMARLLGMPLEHIELRWREASGSYGRNGLEHVIADAALMSQAVGRPVRVQWMRWDEHGWEPKGPPIVQDLEGAVDDKGNVVAWRHRMWIPTTGDTHLIAAELAKTAEIGATGRGRPAIRYSYTFGNADVSCHGEGKVALLTAWLRSPAQFETTYAMEAFIDELAAAAGRDPLELRLAYLKDPRALGVLRAAAHAYGWRSRPSPAKGQDQGGTARGRGIAWVNRDDSYVATIADVAVDRASGRIRVERVVVAHDCGLVVNPDGLKNQIEGNIIQSISRTLHEEVTFDRARVTSLDWQGYPILRFEEIPDRIEIVLVNNQPDYPSHGGGEPSTCPTAAVISNAVFDATGVRLRRTPFRPERVKAAMA
ncbi:molybdopterin-dependent oxidoreductase [Candidimonas humi]|uniref:Molybdopterin cofactor-binding domain-containing protein n=1 Tax=Candidimonas humi TaxID=683355 RepID=A0ABV8P0Y2_9BURK|nr:molybdopterin cofactor-binding domain-containing protein [Candidimonas humi]MBV6305709.1 molybdopterin-dependent oxidoreductase [Candidimonas humi]